MLNLDTLMTYANATQKALLTGFQQAQKEFYTNLPNHNNTTTTNVENTNTSKLEFVREPIVEGEQQSGGGNIHNNNYHTFLSVNNDVPAYSRYGANSNQCGSYWEYNNNIIGGKKISNKKKQKNKNSKKKYRNKKGGNSIFLSVNNDVPAYSRYGANSNQCGSYWEYSKLRGGKSLKKSFKKNNKR